MELLSIALVVVAGLAWHSFRAFLHLKTVEINDEVEGRLQDQLDAAHEARKDLEARLQLQLDASQEAQEDLSAKTSKLMDDVTLLKGTVTRSTAFPARSGGIAGSTRRGR